MNLQAYRTFVVWNRNVPVIIAPVLLLFADLGTCSLSYVCNPDSEVICSLTIALGVWSTWTLAHTPNSDDPITAAVSVRVRYFFVVTFAVNALCAGMAVPALSSLVCCFVDANLDCI